MVEPRPRRAASARRVPLVAGMARGELTRAALLRAAIAVFARDGYHAASTRTIARSAKANQALIGYHFGGKQGLYLAVFDHIAQQMRTRAEPLQQAIRERLLAAPPRARGVAAAKQREALLQVLLQLLDGMTALLAEASFTTWAQLIVREQQAPTAAFDLLYEHFMGPALAQLAHLVMRLKPRIGADNARLLVATIVGQVLFFRAARSGALRHMGWSSIGPAELAAIQRRVRANVVAVLNAEE